MSLYRTLPDHPIWLGAWMGGVCGALWTGDSFTITFLFTAVGMIIGAVVYREDLRNEDE